MVYGKLYGKLSRGIFYCAPSLRPPPPLAMGLVGLLEEETIPKARETVVKLQS